MSLSGPTLSAILVPGQLGILLDGLALRDVLNSDTEGTDPAKGCQQTNHLPSSLHIKHSITSLVPSELITNFRNILLKKYFPSSQECGVLELFRDSGGGCGWVPVVTL